MNIAFLNARGRNGESIQDAGHRWQDIHRIAGREKLAITGVVETHLDDEQVKEIEESTYGQRLKIFNSCDNNHTRRGGVAIVLNRDLINIEGVQVQYLIPGRAILAKIPWHGTETITALVLYAPSGDMVLNAAFWHELSQLFLKKTFHIPDIVLTDANVTTADIDRLPERKDDPKAVLALQAFLTMLGLKDGWRDEHEGVKDFTHTVTKHGEPVSYARLDRIYTSETLKKRCRNWTISDSFAGLTDHRMVTVQIRAKIATYQGRGRYSMQQHSHKDQILLDQAEEIGIPMENLMIDIEASDPTSTRTQSLFDELKDQILELERQRNKEAVGATRAKFAQLFNAKKDVLKET
ncbi:Endonuclease/exonuclease/phosphatase, partial [Mycena floridula]